MDHFDVVIVGAGLSGIGAACHLRKTFPNKTYTVLEGRESLGGTWDLFRYPGVRSDSDMHTLGYAFRPWKGGKSFADGPSILEYIRETAEEHGVLENIRYGHRVTRATWSSEEARWTLEMAAGEGGESKTVTCHFLLMCSGYYDYEAGYTPPFPGMESFAGRIVHPQKWTNDIDYANKRVVVIGSGATAVTLLPSLAKEAKHVTMLQRSPSYVLALPGSDRAAKVLHKLLSADTAHGIIRWKNILLAMGFFETCRRAPGFAKAILRKQAKDNLPEHLDVDTHFSPKYNPWVQRLCVAPDGDFFKALRSERATVVTDHVDTFTEKGLRLKSGRELEADLIVLATGLNLLPLGGLRIVVDGKQVSLPDQMVYKGAMLSDVPNMAFAFGYTNASWTLKCGLTYEYVSRLLQFMDKHGHRQCIPRKDASVRELPFADLTAGYLLRSLSDFPHQGSETPWRVYQNFLRDLWLLQYASIQDKVMEFSATAHASTTVSSPTPEPEQAAKPERELNGTQGSNGVQHVHMYSSPH